MLGDERVPMVEHARRLIVWVSGRHPSLSLLVRARAMIALSGTLGNPSAQGQAVDFGIPPPLTPFLPPA